MAAAIGSAECVTEPSGTLLNGPLHRVAGNHRWVVVGVHAARADNTP
jgi:hypothetical protein